MRLKTKRCVTLIEMMIVMFLIAMILGVIGYNYQGSLEKGKAFKTEAGIEKLRAVLMLDLAEHPEHLANLSTSWSQYVENSPIVQNTSSLTRDGWGNPYTVQIGQDGELLIISTKYEQYKNKG